MAADWATVADSLSSNAKSKLIVEIIAAVKSDPDIARAIKKGVSNGK